ncbi:MAG: hypothetical protein KF849_09095 [Rhizobiaceae bacterium]|nr:hypothetical protein [Rhizobiaceae bacterium]
MIICVERHRGNRRLLLLIRKIWEVEIVLLRHRGFGDRDRCEIVFGFGGWHGRRDGRRPREPSGGEGRRRRRYGSQYGKRIGFGGLGLGLRRRVPVFRLRRIIRVDELRGRIPIGLTPVILRLVLAHSRLRLQAGRGAQRHPRHRLVLRGTRRFAPFEHGAEFVLETRGTCSRGGYRRLRRLRCFLFRFFGFQRGRIVAQVVAQTAVGQVVVGQVYVAEIEIDVGHHRFGLHAGAVVAARCRTLVEVSRRGAGRAPPSVGAEFGSEGIGELVVERIRGRCGFDARRGHVPVPVEARRMHVARRLVTVVAHQFAFEIEVETLLVVALGLGRTRPDDARKLRERITVGVARLCASARKIVCHAFSRTRTDRTPATSHCTMGTEYRPLPAHCGQKVTGTFREPSASPPAHPRR